MGFLDDHQRGVRDGYSGIPTAPPSSAAESMGRTEGQNQRFAEDDQRRRAASAEHSVPLVSARHGLVGVALLVAWLLGVRVMAMLLLAAGLLGLAATPWVRRLLRQLTPVYLGAMCGVCVSALSLITSGAPVIADNVVIFPGLGAAAGALFVVGRFLVRRLRG